MKMILVVILALSSLTAFSQVADPVELDFSSIQEAMAKLNKAHTDSAKVQELKQEVESKYGVKCEGHSSTIFPDVTKTIKYAANCKGEKDLKLVVRSKFKLTQSGVEFTLRSYEVEL